MSVIALSHVTKSYPSTPPVVALDDVSFDVDQGEFLAMVGPSGSGKSTLLNLLGALDRPSSGDVRIAGHCLSALDDDRLASLRSLHIGFVFQNFMLLDSMSARDNVAAGLLYRGHPKAVRLQRAGEALDRVGLGHRAHHHPGALSGGERQRVAIARAIVGRPTLVLADEPTGNLDTRTGRGILDLFEELNASGSTVVLITHDTVVAERARRRVAVRDGRIEQ